MPPGNTSKSTREPRWVASPQHPFEFFCFCSFSFSTTCRPHTTYVLTLKFNLLIAYSASISACKHFKFYTIYCRKHKESRNLAAYYVLVSPPVAHPAGPLTSRVVGVAVPLLLAAAVQQIPDGHACCASRVVASRIRQPIRSLT